MQHRSSGVLTAVKALHAMMDHGILFKFEQEAAIAYVATVLELRSKNLA